MTHREVGNSPTLSGDIVGNDCASGSGGVEGAFYAYYFSFLTAGRDSPLALNRADRQQRLSD